MSEIRPQTPKVGQVYTAIIIAVYNQEQEQTEDKKGWNRYRLVIDIADGESKGYYTYNFEDFQRRQYLGVIDWYLPSEDYNEGRYTYIERRLEQQATADKVKSTNTTYAALGIVPVTAAEKSYYYDQKRSIDNISAILKYNNLDTLPADWVGLLIPIRLSIKDGVMPTIDGWLPSVSATVSATADTDLTHYANSEDIDAVINKAPRPKLTDILNAKKVKGKDIVVATDDDITALRAKLQALRDAKKSNLKTPSNTPQMPSILPSTTDPTPFSSLAPKGCEANIKALVEAIQRRQMGEVHNVDIDKIAADFGVIDMDDELEREKEQTRRQKAINQAKTRAEQEFLEMFAPPKY